MNQHRGDSPPHGGAPQQYVDDPVQQGQAAGGYAQQQYPGQQQYYGHPQYFGYAVQPGRGGQNGEWVACPRCRSPYVNKAKFTWWGGVVGPLIIPEVKCATCGHSYNGKTGGPLGVAIAVYLVVVLGFFFALAVAGAFVLVTSS